MTVAGGHGISASFGVSFTVKAANTTDFENGKYGAAQVFDVQRSPAYPGGTQAEPAPYTISGFRPPLDGKSTPGALTWNDGDYLHFK